MNSIWYDPDRDTFYDWKDGIWVVVQPEEKTQIEILKDMVRDISRIHESYLPLEEAAMDFVKKVDVGTARSKDSYSKFKNALEHLNDF